MHLHFPKIRILGPEFVNTHQDSPEISFDMPAEAVYVIVQLAQPL
jgi:hypothetical protein